ncbi:methyltransferase domain-containing protein [Tessaracoccus rhinocerotis]|uniref:Methyltransferase domain-containing protein n=1 Tax=Tessaracoccus rhinocerotis TaxID=1689449 RepID=A0A553K401_9ACTN|nr:methyltransferase domain-containing protein [Tessaracoccus rhinocerotis]TRY19432.1 methyltransferase domain-containing protein [Tessaracoccus rhinocerotis]
MTTLEENRPHDYLSRLAVSDFGQAYKRLALDEMALRPGHDVLDLGCGPGADLPAFAEAVGHNGTVLGVDHDADAVREALRATVRWPQVAVAEGDAHKLTVENDSLDRVHTDRVLQHVEDPARVVREVCRVLKPGGIVGFAEPDWETLVVDHPDNSTVASYRAFIVDRVVRNSRIGRQLPALCTTAGLLASRVVPVTAVYTDVIEADQVFGFARVTDRAVKAGYLKTKQADAWLTHLRTQPFFASATLFLTVAERPPR